MAKTELEASYKGRKFTVTHCEGAIESFYETLESVEPRKRQNFTNSIILQIRRLTDGEKMSNENFPQEGDLPKKHGRQNPKKFRALKKKPLRGYCWLSEVHDDTYFISHYTHKNFKKLKASDSTRVGNNWNRIEEKGDER